jgi:hypothetical protein
MPATMTTISAITKELYEKDVREQLNNETVALTRVQKTSEGITSDVGGKYVVFPTHMSRNSGIGARNESEALPTAGNQGTAAARVGLKYLYGRVQLTGQTMELAKSNPQAFMSTLDLEVNGLKTDLAKDLNRQVYGDTLGGIAVSSATYTTTNDIVVTHTTWIEEGMVVDVTTSAGVAIASGVTVTAVDTATNTVTVDGSTISGSAGDLIVRKGNYGREWNGFGSIVKVSGTLYNINPSTYPRWKSTVDSNSGTNRALSEGLMILMADTIRTKGGSTSLILQNLGVRRAYFNLLAQQRRFTNTQNFEGGFSGLAFTTDKGDIPVVADTDAPPNTQYFINEKELKWYREGDWSFMDRDGSMWQRVVGYDAYEGTMFQYSELGTHRRNSHGVIQDITEG